MICQESIKQNIGTIVSNGNHKSEPDTNGFIAVVRPVPDILAYRNRFMDFMFEGLEFR